MMRVTDEMIHPELRPYVDQYRDMLPSMEISVLEEAQKATVSRIPLMKREGVIASETTIPGYQGREMRLCEFRGPHTKEGAVGLMWIHGGGLSNGVPDNQHFIKPILDCANCFVISPEYTRSIEAPYPAAVEDCYQAILWMKNHAEELGIRGDQLFIAGDSAGGGLAAAVTQLARDRREVKIAFQLLLYPMLDDRMITESSRDNDAPVWNSKMNQAAWNIYLNGNAGGADISPYAAPARAKDFSGLPSAYGLVGSVEVFRDETVQYIENLKAAGIEASCDVYPGCFHSFDYYLPETEIAKKATAAYVEHFMKASEHCFAKQDN